MTDSPPARRLPHPSTPVCELVWMPEYSKHLAHPVRRGALAEGLTAAALGFGRMVGSEIAAPNMLVNLV
jgi:hypothetical protein